MAALPRITAFAWVPEFARGYVRDLRPRWAFEEVGQEYETDLVRDSKTPEHRRVQPFGQIPTYRDDEVEIFESGAIVLRIAERAGQLLPRDPASRMQAIQWLVAALNTMEPAVMALVVNDVFEAERPWSRDRRPLLLDWVTTRLTDLGARLEGRTWLVDESFTVADLGMISVLAGLREMDVLHRVPAVEAYVTRGLDRPAYKRAMAEHMADFDRAQAA
jgi:glutathione S-transferase